MVSLQLNIFGCFFCLNILLSSKNGGKSAEDTCSQDFHVTSKSSLDPESSISKNELSQNDCLFSFVVSSLKAVLFGIGD